MVSLGWTCDVLFSSVAAATPPLPSKQSFELVVDFVASLSSSVLGCSRYSAREVLPSVASRIPARMLSGCALGAFASVGANRVFHPSNARDTWLVVATNIYSVWSDSHQGLKR